MFSEIWQDQLAAGTEFHYIPGQNRRVDVARDSLPGGKKLLDVGCGSGTLGTALREKYGEIHGIDISHEAVAIARRNGVLAVQAEVGSSRLPFEDRTFDAVTLLSVLQYFYEPVEVVRECSRVLNHGGVLAVSVANLRSLGKLYRQFVTGRFPVTSKTYRHGYDGGAMHYFCSGDVVALLQREGFKVDRRMGIFVRPRWLESFPSHPAWLRDLKTEFLSGEVYLQASKEEQPA